MKLRAQVLPFVLFLVVCGAAAQPASSNQATSKSLSRAIATILADPNLSHAHWGISVIAADGQPIYALNAGQSFEPASNAKLFTTATAFAVFSPESQFKTNVVARGTLEADGTLHGDIVIEGSGNPSISGRSWPYAGKTERPNPPLQALQQLASQIANGGLVHKVTGRVVGDDTFFPFERYGQGWGWDDLQWDYGAPIAALTVNDNVVYLDLMPGAAPEDPIAATWNPPVPYYALENTAVTSAPAPKPQLGLDRQPGSKTVRLFGTLPVNSKEIASRIGHRRPRRIQASALPRLPPELLPRPGNRSRRRSRSPAQTSNNHSRVSRSVAGAIAIAAPHRKKSSRNRHVAV